MSNKQNKLSNEILKALKVIEDKTGIKREDFDKYPSEDLISILLKTLTPVQRFFLKDNVMGYEYLPEDKDTKWFCDAWLYYFYDRD